MQMPSDAEIQARFAELPPEVQAAIQSADMTAALSSVGAAHGLHVDQLGLLEDETLLVMLGFANPAAFASRVASALAVDAGAAERIAEEVSAQLFVPIREAMRTYMEERLKRTERKNRPAASPAPAPAPTAQAPAISSSIPAAGGGTTFMPSAVSPVLHPADQAFAAPAVTLPAVTDLAAPAAAAEKTEKKYAAVDPYREPIE